MKIKHIVYTLLLLGFTALVVYRIMASKEKPPAGKGSASGPMHVQGYVAEPKDFSNTLSLTGTIEADEQVTIQSEISGLVRKIYFKEGSLVSKGQLLLKIDDSELRAQLAQAKTKQQLAAENEERARLLLEKEAVSREEYDVTLADLKSAQAQLQLIEAQLAKTSIRAPFSGRIGLRSISEGSYLSPQTVITRLVKADPVKITCAVPGKYASQISVNTQIQFTVPGVEKSFSAQIYAVEPGIETATRTLQLRARAANPDNLLLPGSFAAVKLPLAVIRDAILIPSQAVVPVQEGKKVFTADNGKAREIMIETAERTESDVLVTKGLNAGDTILTTGVMALKNGIPVKVDIGKEKNKQL